MQTLRIFQAPGHLVHPEIGQLYQHGFHIPADILQVILALPKASVISDLEAVLLHAEQIYRVDPDFNFEFKYHSFPYHAVMLLGRMDDDAALEALLRHLSKDEDILEFWYSDGMTEDIWISLYHLGRNRLDQLKKFVLRTDLQGEFQREVGAQAVVQIGLQDPEKKEAVIAWVREVMEQIFRRKDEQIIGDDFLASCMVAYISQLGARDLLPLIELMFDTDLIDETIAGSWEVYLEEFDRYREYGIMKAYPDLLDWYKNAAEEEDRVESERSDSTWNEDLNEDDFNRQLVDLLVAGVSNHSGAYQKVGRNEPCPCGSGKKYKRCCGK